MAEKSKNSNGASVSCIFCKIAKKEIPAEIVHEDDVSLSFLDINPVHEGHLLIIPKVHFASFEETPDEIVEKLFVKSKELMSVLQKAVGADYVVVSVVGIDIPHFHIHLIPKYMDDGHHGWPTKKYDSIERMKEVGEKIRKGFK